MKLTVRDLEEEVAQLRELVSKAFFDDAGDFVSGREAEFSGQYIQQAKLRMRVARIELPFERTVEVPLRSALIIDNFVASHKVLATGSLAWLVRRLMAKCPFFTVVQFSNGCSEAVELVLTEELRFSPLLTPDGERVGLIRGTSPASSDTSILDKVLGVVGPAYSISGAELERERNEEQRLDVADKAAQEHEALLSHLRARTAGQASPLFRGQIFRELRVSLEPRTLCRDRNAGEGSKRYEANALVIEGSGLLIAMKLAGDNRDYFHRALTALAWKNDVYEAIEIRDVTDKDLALALHMASYHAYDPQLGASGFQNIKSVDKREVLFQRFTRKPKTVRQRPASPAAEASSPAMSTGALNSINMLWHSTATT